MVKNEWCFYKKHQVFFYSQDKILEVLFSDKGNWEFIGGNWGKNYKGSSFTLNDNYISSDSFIIDDLRFEIRKYV